ncbi:hypothetical protein MMSR116_08370 [Methylobacterium mesophilicum SR1.6/6]|uniref:Uncharacterized protein n=1 Tax=Methylobacterium mesophilicum SR1.6/6 TaxID=908290 RepID=A0A6B9FGM2_9HYPH|nr:hypothetical protein [Methylobacterium mesophilicum]QGY01891.1 hypothetical protein MMSR116_08370 [Methylobacterium mesophilicum SR1.6/6]
MPAETNKLADMVAGGSASARVVPVDDNDEVYAVTASYPVDAGFRVDEAVSAQAGLGSLERGGTSSWGVT